MMNSYIQPRTSVVVLNVSSLLDTKEWNGTSEQKGAGESDAKRATFDDNDNQYSWEVSAKDVWGD